MAKRRRRDEAVQAIAAAAVEDFLRLGVEPFGCEGAMRLITAQEMALPPLLSEPAD
ncbi:MAG: hypothetical protein H0U28_00795 [Nocardioidaceae bacterium]|nr:hypothetical protein [Nocardioidaceae bacterium]